MSLEIQKTEMQIIKVGSEQFEKVKTSCDVFINSSESRELIIEVNESNESEVKQILGEEVGLGYCLFYFD